MRRVIRLLAGVGLAIITATPAFAQANCGVSLGSHRPAGTLRYFDADGTLGVVYDRTEPAIIIWDLSVPPNPQRLGKLSGVTAMDVAVSNQLLIYVDGTKTLWIYSLGNPSSPSLVSTYTTAGDLDRVDADGPFVVARSSERGLVYVFDISNPGDIKLRGFVGQTQNLSGDIAISGTKLFVTNESSRIQEYSLAGEKIVSKGFTTVQGANLTRMAADARVLAAYDTNAKALMLFDTTSAIAPIGSASVPTAFDIGLAGCTAYVVTNTFETIDISTCGSSLCKTANNANELLAGRFVVRAEWADSVGNKGTARAVRLTDSAGYFWFFDASNAEVQVKMLNACVAPFNRYWFFAAGLTNVEVKIEVTDRQTGRVFTYTNPQGTPFAPIQDTGTIDVCP
jgi:hypothetical protein